MIDGDVAPSGELVSALAAVDPTTLDEEELLELITAWERVRSYVQAGQNDAFVAWERLTTPVVGNSLEAASNHRWASVELGLVLDLSAGAAWRRVSHAVTLAEKLPEAAAALRAGRISVTHAEKAAVRAHDLPVAIAREVDRAVMADPDWRTPSQLERTFAAQIARLDPEGAADRARRARKERDVRLRPEDDGMATLTAVLPAEQASLAYETIDAHARSSKARNEPGDDRRLTERRADALVELIIGPREGATPKVHGRVPQIRVTVSWSTLVGLDDLPADLTGYGPIDAATARRIAAEPDSVWRRLLVDPAAGRLLDYGTRTYQPPQDLMDFVAARDRVCCFPGCEHPATVCDFDHRRPFGCGGGTAPANIDALCPLHHRLKHEAGWTHERDPKTGDSVWITPRGTRYGRRATALPRPDPVEPPHPPDDPSPPDDSSPPPF